MGTKSISLQSLGIKSSVIHYQLTSEELQSVTIQKKQGKNTSLGALAIHTGEFNGRSPKDRFIVKDKLTEEEVWWGGINIPFQKMELTSPFLFRRWKCHPHLT